MSPTSRPMALLPHEIDQIDHVFQDILRERGLPRDCETAEAIAKRILTCYQSGIRERGALKYTVGFDISSVATSTAGPLQGKPEVSMQEITTDSTIKISPNELDMLQRTFDRVCTWCSIPRYGKRAERLARHITEQFSTGLRDESALFESAMWLDRNSDAASNRPDA